jgi:hypothetical protein
MLLFHAALVSCEVHPQQTSGLQAAHDEKDKRLPQHSKTQSSKLYDTVPKHSSALIYNGPQNYGKRPQKNINSYQCDENISRFYIMFTIMDKWLKRLKK